MPRPGGLRPRRRQLGRTGGVVPRPLRPTGPHHDAGRRTRGIDVAIPHRADPADPQHCGPPAHHGHRRGRHGARGVDPHPRYQGERDRGACRPMRFSSSSGPPHGRIGWRGRSTATTKASFCAGSITSQAVPEDWPLDRRPYALETRVPGVFVAGDVRKGSVKRLTVAAGEGAAAIDLVHRYLEATFDRPAREDRQKPASAPMTAAASASGEAELMVADRRDRPFERFFRAGCRSRRRQGAT